MKLNRRFFIMTFLSALFGRKVQASAPNLRADMIQLVGARCYLPAFSGAINPPQDCFISIEEDDAILFEKKSKDFMLRLSSLSVTFDKSNQLNDDKSFSSVIKNIIYSERLKDKLVTVESESSSRKDYYFYFCEISNGGKIVLASITVLRKSFIVSDTDAIEIFLKIAATFESCNDEMVEKSLLQIKSWETSIDKYKSFSRDELANFKISRLQSCRLSLQEFGHYPLDANKLDSLFVKAVMHPDHFNGIAIVKVLIGCCLGDYLVAKYGFKWRYVEDEIGRDLAVIHENSGNEIVIFPMDFVQKRDSADQAGFIASLEEFVVKSLKSKAN
jgi:hypothetical protein